MGSTRSDAVPRTRPGRQEAFVLRQRRWTVGIRFGATGVASTSSPFSRGRLDGAGRLLDLRLRSSAKNDIQWHLEASTRTFPHAQDWERRSSRGPYGAVLAARICAEAETQ